jgi:hypothetical protein
MLQLTQVENGIRLEIKVQPRSSKNQIVGEHNGALKVKLTAPPVEGEANQALLAYLASILKIPKKNVVLLKGESSRNKILEIRGVNVESFLKKTGLK